MVILSPRIGPSVRPSLKKISLFPYMDEAKVESQDPRSKVYPEMNIPGTASSPPPNHHHFRHPTFGFMSGPSPVTTARLGNFTVSEGFGLFPVIFGFHMHGFPDGVGYAATPGYNYGFSNPLQGGHLQTYNQQPARQQEEEAMLCKYLVIIGMFVLLFLFFL